MKFLITADPADSLNGLTDSSLLMAAELLKADQEVYWCDLFQNLDSEVNNLSVQKIISVNPGVAGFSNYISLAPVQKLDVQNFHCLLHRKDPPVNEDYIKFHKKFFNLDSKILQVNKAESLLKYKEHLFPNIFPDYSHSTIAVHTDAELRDAYSRFKKIVVKPDNEGRGIGIEFVFDQNQLDSLINKKPYPCVVQEFFPNVNVEGDLRVLAFRGRVLGQLLRIPKEGSLLANLYQGGSATWRELSSYERDVSIRVSKELETMGISLAGIDFLGSKISEINITSPTGFCQASNLTGKNIVKQLISDLITLLSTRSS